MRTFMYFTNCGREIGEAISLPTNHTALELFAACDHLPKHVMQAFSSHLARTGWRMQHRGETHTVKAKRQKFVEGLAEFEVRWRYRYSGGNLHAALHPKQGFDVSDDARETPCATVEWAQQVVHTTDSVDADCNCKPKALEKVSIVSAEQRPIRG